MIINEMAGSGGDLMPYMFKGRKLGPLERAVSEALRLLKANPGDRMMKEPVAPTWGKRKP